ncbi:MAG: NADH-quinone oxidoreductase subunit C [Armatimonadetes bacterium]|nr:NADH-quinone oxidoreductase subunit C [Armatimonadota bacterium]
MSEFVEKAIRNTFPDAVRETAEIDGVLNVKLDPLLLVAVCRFLRSEPELAFDYLADITAIDWRDRIEVVYRMTNLATNAKVVLRVDLDRNKPEVDSVVPVWRGAEWQEREVYDLMGVVFRGHPDLRRILLPDDWEGHPLRKDYVIPD